MPVSRALLWGIIIGTLGTGLAAPRGASGGSIKGTVVLKGATPELRKLAVTIDQYVCGKEKNPEDLLLSPQGGIRNAVVWLDKPPATATADALPAVTALGQRGGMVAPRGVAGGGGGGGPLPDNGPPPAHPGHTA